MPTFTLDICKYGSRWNAVLMNDVDGCFSIGPHATKRAAIQAHIGHLPKGTVVEVRTLAPYEGDVARTEEVTV